MDFIKEANDLARKVLNQKCLSLFSEARIFGIERNRKFVFFFKNQAGLIFFNKDKEKLLQRLRDEYRKKKALYDKEDFIFYEVLGKTKDEIKHRDDEEEKILLKGIERLESVLKQTKENKRYGLSA
ncbi:hypothetical protein [Campylobacter helveticus]|uniref:Uncharacterized protein n=1 Tax=Campylobacter helveticus TaxID=28898 RepID=A0AAX2UIU8_9BACT|nr:hypothetical protein [Campylobacter helveticus]TNB55121.1 hypothetical protein FDW44_09720 [Campylobacter helveticus]TNB56894.1 hypothetical protein FDW42_06380 [Campylobacter helveticus]TNH32684.1 hypothetical protein FDW46_08960 [Campylobacter helveticus]TNH36283.1 hypothetical protein FDW45_05895 [Campylobacter helveticus]